MADATHYEWTYSGTGVTFAQPTNCTSITLIFAANATAGNLTVMPYQNESAGYGSPAFAVEINAFNLTNIELTGDTVKIGDDGVIVLETSENGITYEAYPVETTTVASSNTGTGSSINLNIAANYLIATQNPFAIYAVNGLCKLLIGTEIIYTEREIFVPDAFSPNGDDFNDLYIIRGIENYPDNKVEIFNRWGARVYKTDFYDNESSVWDGKSQHSLTTGNGVLPEGTYYYIIDLGDGTPLIKGPLYLKK